MNKMTIENTESTAEEFEKIKSTVFRYTKTFAFTFLLPLWGATIINEGIALWKVFTWLHLDIVFWNIKPYASMTILVALSPLVYFTWFYYLLTQKVALQLHKDFFSHWNKTIGLFWAESLLLSNQKLKTGKSKIDVEAIVIFLNRKLSELPKILAWIGKKLVDEIPLVHLINAYEQADLKEKNKDKIAAGITNKINEFQTDQIESMVPNWTMFIIPVNLILLFLYIKS